MPSSVRLLTGVVFLVFALCAFAQDEAAEEPAKTETAKELERFSVTGYHIKRMDIEGPVPVVVFDQAFFEQSGFQTLQEFANFLPINAPAQDSLLSRIGASGFDLRGIGSDATLVLVNGLRVAPYAQAAEISIDINAIPVAAIDRVEILKDGASAIYGADAIAGVVNIILRSDYDGIATSAGYGVSAQGDGEELFADLVFGRETGRASMLLSLSWYDRQPQLSSDRAWSSDLDYSPIGGPNNRSIQGSPPSLARYDTRMFAADPDCGTDPAESSIALSPSGSACRFNFRGYDELYWDFERIGAVFSGRFEINSGLSLFGDLLFSSVEGERVLAPAPIGASTLIPTFLGRPYVPAQHPDNPFGTDGELYYRALDAGSRVVANDSRSWRGVVGLEGLLGDWDWRISGLVSRNEVDAGFSNFVLEDRFQLALLGMGGPDGSEWYNPFGFQPQNDPGLIDWLTADSTSKDESSEHSLDLLFRRRFGNLPGGMAGVAVGMQYREQELQQWADELLKSGALTGGAEHFPITADREIGSAFVEFNLPLLASLEAQLALRYEDYSDFGATTNPKVALRWQPRPSLMFRGSYSTSFKPPSFYELYLPVSSSFAGLVDPVRCAITGLPQDCEEFPYFTEARGNPDLGPEDGASWFAGTVWTPEFLPGFELQLDFWKFNHENRVEWSPAWLALANGSDFGVVREPTEPDGTPGRIVRITETYVNVDELRTRGFDTTLRYAWQTDTAGEFRASLLHTYIDNWEWLASLNEVFQDQNFAGRGSPRNRASAHLAWKNRAHSAATNIHYAGHYETFTRLWVDGQPTDRFLTVPSHTTLDLQYSYTFERFNDSALRVGCENCLDKDPPLHYFPVNDSFHDGRGRYYYVRWQQSIR